MNKKTTRWIAILLVILAALSLACGTGGALPVGEGQDSGDVSENEGRAPAADGTITVEAKEFSFSLSASETRAGEVTFEVQNTGTMPHDFAIRGDGVDEATAQIDPGQSATLTVQLEPGTYTYICTIPGHEQLGMRGTFNVTSS